MDNSIVNALTIDVEDYFQVAAFDKQIDPNDWDQFECRVEQNVNLLLDSLQKANTKATFFTLGWVAKRYPQVIRSIVSQGHELASHGYGHAKVNTLTPLEFKTDLIQAKDLLEDISGQSVTGYRAPSFSIGRDNLWALNILSETGHLYSSSIYPIAHDHYGMPEAPRFAYKTNANIIEIPPSSIALFGRNWPASGGGYFRLFPYSLSKRAIARVNEIDKQPAIFYCHPWEFDPDQPRIKNAPAKSKFRHYVNLETNLKKFEALISDFRWAPMREVFSAHLS